MERSWLLDTVNGDMLAEPKLHHGCGTSRGYETRNSEDKRFHLEIILSLARNAVMIPSNAFLPILRENSKHGTWGCSTFRQPVLIDFEGFITWPAYDRFIFFQFLPVFIWGFGAGRSSKIDGLCRARDARVAEVSPTFFS